MRRVLWLLGCLAAGGPLRAQDTVALRALQEAAVAHDPRAREFALQQTALGLRLADIVSEWLPQPRLSAEASHQSEALTLPIHVPGISIPQPPQDHWQGVLEVDQSVWDGGARVGRRAVERAQTAEQAAQLRTTLYGLRAQVNEAFFSALLLQSQLAENASLASDLEAELGVVRAQYGAGTALAGDTAALVVQLLQAEDSRGELLASQAASLAVLARLTGEPLRSAAVLEVPALAPAVDAARAAAAADGVRTRPEYLEFEATRARLARQAALVGTERWPQLSGYLQAAVARPGLNQFSTTVDRYWIAGVRLQWQPWRWGSIARQEQELEVERDLVAADAAAFTAELDRGVQSDLATTDRLRPALARDERIVALREVIEREARAQLGEHAITAARYVDRRTDLADARLARARHRVQLAQAEANYLNTLGVELP